MRLNCNNLLTSFNAIPYEVTPLPEEMTSFGDDNLPLVIPNVNLDYERARDDWAPITTYPAQANDSRLPRTFVDGALNSVEIAGSVQDNMGYARSIRAGQLGAGAINLDNPTQSSISCCYFLAVTTVGYSQEKIAPLKNELQNSTRRFDLITWQGTSDYYFKNPEERELLVRDVATVRKRLRRRVTDVMLERERELVCQLGSSIYADGRYVDHMPGRVEQLVIGIIKSMRRRYLDISRQQILYNLKVGERTPAFETESQNFKIISFYARISSERGGATNGLVRVELDKAHFEIYKQKKWSLLDAITAHITQLKTKDATYARAAVTLEPIQVIEQRMQRLFHSTERVAMSALNLLRQ